MGPWGPPPAWRRLSVSETAALAAIYADVDATLAEVLHTCRACGKCCRFTPDGIILFATAMELSYLVGDSPRPPQGDAWTCPYQQGSLCVARDRRPLGCHTYFCDMEARGAGEEVVIVAVERIRRLAQEAGLAWYGPAVECLSSWPRAER